MKIYHVSVITDMQSSENSKSEFEELLCSGNYKPDRDSYYTDWDEAMSDYRAEAMLIADETARRVGKVYEFNGVLFEAILVHDEDYEEDESLEYNADDHGYTFESLETTVSKEA